MAIWQCHALYFKYTTLMHMNWNPDMLELLHCVCIIQSSHWYVNSKKFHRMIGTAGSQQEFQMMLTGWGSSILFAPSWIFSWWALLNHRPPLKSLDSWGVSKKRRKGENERPVATTSSLRSRTAAVEWYCSTFHSHSQHVPTRKQYATHLTLRTNELG